MTANFRALLAKSPNIAQEFAATGRMVNKPDDFPAFLRKSTPGAKAREALNLRYEGRKNQCPHCFTAIPMTGNCDCRE